MSIYRLYIHQPHHLKKLRYASNRLQIFCYFAVYVYEYLLPSGYHRFNVEKIKTHDFFFAFSSTRRNNIPWADWLMKLVPTGSSISARRPLPPLIPLAAALRRPAQPRYPVESTCSDEPGCGAACHPQQLRSRMTVGNLRRPRVCRSSIANRDVAYDDDDWRHRCRWKLGMVHAGQLASPGTADALAGLRRQHGRVRLSEWPPGHLYNRCSPCGSNHLCSVHRACGRDQALKLAMIFASWRQVVPTNYWILLRGIGACSPV
jgi:hypothetical protein